MALGFNPEDFLNNPLVHIGLNLLAQQRNPGEGLFPGVARGALGGMGSVATMRANQQAAQDAALQRQMAQMKIDQFKKQQEARQRLSGSIRSGIKPQAFNQTPEEIARGNELDMVAGAVESGLDLGDTSNLMKTMRGGAEKPKVHNIGPYGVLVDEQGKEIFRNEPPARAGSVIRGRDVLYVPDPNSENGFRMVPAPGVGPAPRAPKGFELSGPGGKPMTSTEQKRLSGIAAIEFAETELGKLKQMITATPYAVGPSGAVMRVLETAKGVVNPWAKAPSLDLQKKQAVLLAALRKRLTDSQTTNKEMESVLATMGGDIMTTGSASIQSINTLLELLGNQRSAMQAAGGEKPKGLTGDQEAWISRAMQANPGMTREQVVEEGKKRGKL